MVGRPYHHFLRILILVSLVSIISILVYGHEPYLVAVVFAADKALAVTHLEELLQWNVVHFIGNHAVCLGYADGAFEFAPYGLGGGHFLIAECDFANFVELVVENDIFVHRTVVAFVSDIHHRLAVSGKNRRDEIGSFGEALAGVGDAGKGRCCRHKSGTCHQ